MPKNEEIQECRVVMSAGDDEHHEDIFKIRLLPNGRIEVEGNPYYQPLINHIFGTVIPGVIKGLGVKKGRAMRRREEREGSKIIIPSTQEAGCLRH